MDKQLTITPSERDVDRAHKQVRAKGGICLVPREGRGGISSHERSFCDCTVEEMIAEARAAERASLPESVIEAIKGVQKFYDYHCSCDDEECLMKSESSKVLDNALAELKAWQEGK